MRIGQLFHGFGKLSSIALFLAVSLWLGGSAGAQNMFAAETNYALLPTKIAPSSELFTNGPILRIRIEIAPELAAKLRLNSRKYVAATISDEKKVYTNVAIHLKGAVGSFRPIDGKPSFTLNFEKFSPGQKFHGLRKLHLNNSVEDPSYLNEYLGNELFRTAGLPAPRVTHAVVEFNGRQLGLYVLKEGFAEEFLSLYFQRTNGNLYDTGTGNDVNEPLEKDQGNEPEDDRDLKALAAATFEPDLVRRWQALEKTLDVERFISFMAMEIMIGHRDGYCLARNNFRLYYNADTGKMLFFPHGMDILFGKADLPYKPYVSGSVAKSIMGTPQGSKMYQQQFGVLLSNVFNVPRLHGLADKKVAQLRKVLSSKEGRDLENAAKEVKQRIADRYAHLQKQLLERELVPITFQNGVAMLKDWRMIDVPPGGGMESVKTSDGHTALSIRAGPVTAASWRCKLLLLKGKYRFEGLVRTADVEPLKFGRTQGATLRMVGSRVQLTGLMGTTGWQKLQVEFEVAEPRQELDLICELRASKGQAFFDLDSLRLVALP